MFFNNIIFRYLITWRLNSHVTSYKNRTTKRAQQQLIKTTANQSENQTAEQSMRINSLSVKSKERKNNYASL